MSKPAPAIARFAPLVPQLAIALRRNNSEIPEMLRMAGQHGERHIALLVSLEFSGTGTVSELAERLGMSSAHASLVVGDLAKAGLVERDHDLDDRRRILVSLSDKVKPAIREMRHRRAGPLVKFLGELGPDEADAFIAHTARLIEILNER